MNRRELVLAMLAAADGQAYQPAQIQKAVFLVTENLPGVVDGEERFRFEPYDYGPFDRAVYDEAETLQDAGFAELRRSEQGRWRTYAASTRGIEEGRRILAAMRENEQDYVRRVSAWVRSLGFADLVRSIYDAYPQMRANSIFTG